MSLWTPGGEHPVDRDQPRAPARPGPAGPEADGIDPGFDDPEMQAAFEAEMAAAQQQLLEMPAGVVVAQLALQLYELAALHLSRTPPALGEAKVAIDAMAAIVERVGDQLGDATATLREALHQLQVAFVELARRADAPADQAAPPAAPDAP